MHQSKLISHFPPLTLTVYEHFISLSLSLICVCLCVCSQFSVICVAANCSNFLFSSSNHDKTSAVLNYPSHSLNTHKYTQKLVTGTFVQVERNVKLKITKEQLHPIKPGCSSITNRRFVVLFYCARIKKTQTFNINLQHCPHHRLPDPPGFDDRMLALV